MKSGTKPDRLHAILRNFYWQNVVRFFAGCADAGELDMIIQELKDLQDDDFLKYTNYPRIITSQILSDYVFTQKPLKLKDVVKIIVDGINIGSVINQDGRFAFNEPLLLPNECGRTEVIKECFIQLIKFPNNDYTTELIGIINNNPQNNLEDWSKYIEKLEGIQLTKWLEYAYKLQLIHKIDKQQLISILNEGDVTQTKKRLQLIINGNRLELINENIKLKEIVFAGILNNELSVFPRKNVDHSLNFLTLILHPIILSHLVRSDDLNNTFLNFINGFVDRHKNSSGASSITEFIVVDDIDKKINEFSNSICTIFDIPIVTFKNSIQYWDVFVECARVHFRDNWNIYIIATIAAGIKSKGELYEEYVELNDSSLSLCKRVRCARMKSGNIKYWDKQITNSPDILFTLLIIFTWATPKTIIQLLPVISKIIKSLDLNDFLKLSRGVSSAINNSIFNKTQQRYIENEMKNKKNHDEIKYILSLRFDDNNNQKFIYNNIESFTGVLEEAIEIKFQYLISTYFEEPANKDILIEIKKLYKNIYQYDERLYYRYRTSNPIKIPYEIAQTIMQDCKEYPKIISSLAEKSCRLYANEHLRPVGEIAIAEKWFEDI